MLLVHKALIVGRKDTALVQGTILQLQQQLDALGISHLREEELNPSIGKEGAAIDLVIAVGGDGCFLAASQWALSFNVPILGINCGRLGFLGDVLPSKINEIPHILEAKHIEERAVLEVNQRYLAVNEMLLAGDYLGLLTMLQVKVNGQVLCTYQADGLIVATATGSTGHALSCGGPILEPTSNQIVLAPVASHRLNSRPIVLTALQGLDIELGDDKQPACLIVDGRRKASNLARVHVAMARQKLKVLHALDYNFFNNLRSKLEWEH